MISNKTAITLALIILSIKCVVSTFPSKMLKTRIKKTAPLRDTDNRVTDVPAGNETPMQVDQVEKQPVPVINEHFKQLIEKGRYVEIEEHAKIMDKDEFITQICSVVKTYEQYKKLKNCFKQHKMVEHFYVYGNMTVVKNAVIIDNPFPFSTQLGELQMAIGLALERDKHERVCELLKARQDGTAEMDKIGIKGLPTSFETFMIALLSVLAFWKNIKPLARFITFYGKEFSGKYPDTFAIFCERLVWVTQNRCWPSFRNDNESARKLLNDLVGQPSLLTPMTFSQALLDDNIVVYCKSGFIEYGWKEAIEEGLNGKYNGGGKHLWNAIRGEDPEQYFGDYPPSDEVLDAFLKMFLTKQEREDAWNKTHARILRKRFESLNLDLFPDVFWIPISEYALLWTDVC